MVSESNSQSLPGMVGDSPLMQEVYRLTRRAARSRSSVLLLGETGTGKELIASAIHHLSNRATGPFVRVNCGALTETLLDSELFGHVKGAFTDAHETRAGRFQAAHEGTIFLDEINSTSTTLQVKLLGVLQNREFERVGSTKSVSVNVRVVAASNRDLEKEIHEGSFREDLYWRLNVIPIRLPPLRRRPEDIEPLILHFLESFCQENDRPPVPWRRCRNTLGQATFASCKTMWSGRWSWLMETNWCPTFCLRVSQVTSKTHSRPFFARRMTKS